MAALIMALGALCGSAWALIQYPVKWCDTDRKMDVVFPLVNKIKTDQEIDRAIGAARQEDIVRRLVRMENKQDKQYEKLNPS